MELNIYHDIAILISSIFDTRDSLSPISLPSWACVRPFFSLSSRIIIPKLLFFIFFLSD